MIKNWVGSTPYDDNLVLRPSIIVWFNVFCLDKIQQNSSFFPNEILQS
jgi:hypothetical protein